MNKYSTSLLYFVRKDEVNRVKLFDRNKRQKTLVEESGIVIKESRNIENAVLVASILFLLLECFPISSGGSPTATKKHCIVRLKTRQGWRTVRQQPPIDDTPLLAAPGAGGTLFISFSRWQLSDRASGSRFLFRRVSHFTLSVRRTFFLYGNHP